MIQLINSDDNIGSASATREDVQEQIHSSNTQQTPESQSSNLSSQHAGVDEQQPSHSQSEFQANVIQNTSSQSTESFWSSINVSKNGAVHCHLIFFLNMLALICCQNVTLRLNKYDIRNLCGSKFIYLPHT